MRKEIERDDQPRRSARARTTHNREDTGRKIISPIVRVPRLTSLGGTGLLKFFFFFSFSEIAV